MEFKKTKLDGVVLIKPKVFLDNRGFFLESYSKRSFEDANIFLDFVQDNHSKSTEKGVTRGLHFQDPPFAQSKLLRVIKGSIYDIVVDIRKDSPTYLKWEAFELSEKNFFSLLVPQGFAHGFCTLEPNTEVQYKVDNFYMPAHEKGIRWNDPDLNIPWPVKDPILSQKDSQLPFVSNFISPF